MKPILRSLQISSRELFKPLTDAYGCDTVLIAIHDGLLFLLAGAGPVGVQSMLNCMATAAAIPTHRNPVSESVQAFLRSTITAELGRTLIELSCNVSDPCDFQQSRYNIHICEVMQKTLRSSPCTGPHGVGTLFQRPALSVRYRMKHCTRAAAAIELPNKFSKVWNLPCAAVLLQLQKQYWHALL